MADFQPIRRVDGYLPIADYGLIGDGTTAALVGRDAAIDWLCLPRFDAPPVFCALLDRRPGQGGSFRVTPIGASEGRQRYEDDTGVLVTELRAPTGVLEVTDALTLRKGADLAEDAPAGRGELLRLMRVVEGRVRLRVEVDMRHGAEFEGADGGLRIRCPTRPELDLHLGGDLGLQALEGTFDLAQGDERYLLLRWAGGSPRMHAANPRALLQHTLADWRAWIRHFSYEGPRAAEVRRSALTLKLLDYTHNGAILAAPTSSLPETIGGVRNWDYRYSWIRDAAFSVYALRRIGYPHEAWSFLGWALDASAAAGRPCVAYDLDGERAPPEREDPELQGYRGSRPVRWGNAAAQQRQHDVFGEILDCAWQWMAGGRTIEKALYERLDDLIEAAGREWRQPDHGIWEVRTPGRPFTYSAALCQVALDRGARISERVGTDGKQQRWRRQAEEIRQAILTEAWSEELQSLTEQLGGGRLDASLLALPLRRVLPFEHPRMVATVEAVTNHLGAGDGLLYRYRPDESPDGLPGNEGAFLLCSFWLIDNLAGQGRMEEAEELFHSLCARANPLGLLPEQIDPGTGAFLGNYPQAFSHVGLISSGVNLARRKRVRR